MIGVGAEEYNSDWFEASGRLRRLRAVALSQARLLARWMDRAPSLAKYEYDINTAVCMLV